MSKQAPDPSPRGHGQFLVYEAEDGRIKIDVRLADETVWLTQHLIAELFQTSVPNISMHIRNVYDEGELQPEATIKKFLTVRREGEREVRRQLDYYNLDMIISVGYRVKSHVATRFRIWATQRLKEYIVKGFVLDDERLKNSQQPFDYFEELTRRIQDIRTSERRFYQKITDIYATSVDYDPTLEISLTFFKTVQNKMHWAITGQTAAEIIHARADADKPHTGTIDLHDAAAGRPDVQLIGDLTGPVTGSLLLDSDRRGFNFIRSGGILPFDGYRVRLASGASGFHDDFSALDGNGDGTPGDDWLTRFDFRSTGAGVLGLPDFMRGPGQPVDVPATGKLLPVTFTSPGGMRNLVFTVDYDPRLLDITGAQAASGLPAGSEVRFASALRDIHGQRARITVILPSETTLAAGSTRLVDLVAHVPVGAPYGAKELLDLTVDSLNGSALLASGVADDDAFHLVGYLGDTSGNGAYSTLDGQQIQRVLVQLDAGFAAYPNVDPLIIADINTSGTLTSLDASRVLQEVSYLTGASSVDRPEIPPIPASFGTLFDLDLRIKADAPPGLTRIDLQDASLNDARLTLNVVPQVGADETDGQVTIIGKAPAAATPVTAPLAAAASGPLPPAKLPIFDGGGYVAPVPSSATSPAPVIDLAGSFSLPAAVNEAIVADGKSKPWLNDYLGNVGQVSKVSPNPVNSGLKVTIPVSPAISAASRRVSL